MAASGTCSTAGHPGDLDAPAEAHRRPHQHRVGLGQLDLQARPPSPATRATRSAPARPPAPPCPAYSLSGWASSRRPTRCPTADLAGVDLVHLALGRHLVQRGDLQHRLAPPHAVARLLLLAAPVLLVDHGAGARGLDRHGRDGRLGSPPPGPWPAPGGSRSTAMSERSCARLACSALAGGTPPPGGPGRARWPTPSGSARRSDRRGLSAFSSALRCLASASSQLQLVVERWPAALSARLLPSSSADGGHLALVLLQLLLQLRGVEGDAPPRRS